MSLAYMFVDMNGFFATVEQHDHPELRGRPVAVAAVLVDSTCCIATSYEAKRLGIPTGTPVGEAKSRCPGLVVREARPHRYVEVHHAIHEAITGCLPGAVRCSVDEFACPLSPREREPAAAVALAGRVKQAIRARVGSCLTCSVGLAPNRVLAKVAADMRKPDGLTVLARRDLPAALYPLGLTDLPGIGPRMLVRLRRQGVLTVEQLCALPKAGMVRVWGGVVGEHWWHWLRGERTADRPTRRRTIGHSHVLPPVLRTMAGAKAVLVRLIHRAATRLRKEGYWARRMEVYVSFTYREEGWRGEVGLGLCQDTLTMIQALDALWRHPPPGRQPTQVAVTLYGLTADAYAPLPLFPGEQRRVRLARAMDAINAQLGANIVYFAGAGAALALATATTRIAFTQVPDLDDPDYDFAPSGPRAAPAAAPWLAMVRAPDAGPAPAAWWQR